MSEATNTSHRYHRQMLLPGIGPEGQDRLRGSRGLLVGCGALGTVIADTLVRAGIGGLTIIDRDIVEITNLQRQVLFDEDDVSGAMPKAEAARRRLARINSDVQIDAHVDDFNARNAERFAEGCDVILDGLDNFETRYLLNDLAVKHELPYVYGGAVGTTGMSMVVLPKRPNVQTSKRPHESEHIFTRASDGDAPCLRCIFPEAPPPGTSPTCDTAGVLGPAVMTIAAHQAAQAIKLLTGNVDAVDRSLLSIDMWTNETRRFDVSGARNPACVCCVKQDFQFLDHAPVSGATTLCGRNAVQISPGGSTGDGAATIDLATLAARLEPHGSFTSDDMLLRGTFESERGASGEPIELMLFPNGRAIIRGTDRTEQARSIYARYIGL